MRLQLGEVVLQWVGFHQASGGKVRPAIMLLDTGDDDIVAAPVTSRARISEYDLAIQNWEAAGLNAPSTIRVHKLTVLPKGAIARNLGRMTTPDRDALVRVLARAFSVI